MNVRIGQKVVRTPETIRVMSDKLKLESRPMRGKVTYIHPDGRFHVVEFDSPCGPIRECFAGVMA